MENSQLVVRMLLVAMPGAPSSVLAPSIFHLLLEDVDGSDGTPAVAPAR